jgi:hypothetical protein
MQDNITVLANIIGRVYRGYDEFPDIETDEDMYLEARYKCFYRMAVEYAQALNLGAIVNQEERPKALLRGMLLHVESICVDQPYSFVSELDGKTYSGKNAPIMCDAYLEAHWDSTCEKIGVHGNVIEKRGKDEWIEMDSTIKTMLV